MLPLPSGWSYTLYLLASSTCARKLTSSDVLEVHDHAPTVYDDELNTYCNEALIIYFNLPQCLQYRCREKKRKIAEYKFLLFLSTDIVPAQFVTRTVNQGDDVTLSVSVTTKSGHVKWRKNTKLLKGWTGRTSVTLRHVTLGAAGVYEIFSDASRPHAVIRLIVRRKYLTIDEFVPLCSDRLR